jgi:hypothetical protein
MTYTATTQHENGKREAVSVTAPDYTKAFLIITYANPKTTSIINLEEVTQWKK